MAFYHFASRRRVKEYSHKLAKNIKHIHKSIYILFDILGYILITNYRNDNEINYTETAFASHR